jgi:hypothetical protein
MHKRIQKTGGARVRGRRLAFEPLESRIALAAAGLVDVGAQPEGNFSNKIFYLHPGHGYENQDGTWNFQRSEVAGTEMIEDLGTVDQMTFLADYLFRSGATIAALRPIGHQVNEVVLDNDSPGVTFVGPGWTNSTSTVFYGSAGDTPYKYVDTSATETAYARYRPTIPQAGFYPVYAWTRPGSDRATDQLYRINHTGGITEVTINHRRVGNGPIYLGTYYFDAGTNGYVDISNRSANAGSVVIADMIRFGNGIGESGLPREDEAGLYWIEAHAAPPYAQGIDPSEYGTSVVTAGPKYAEFMNREQDGVLADRAFLSYHSNAAGTTARGVLALHNTSHGGTTPNQVLYAQTLADEINFDLVAQNAQWDPDWAHRSNRLYENPDFNYGEINNAYINNEFDATIVEVAFHDNTLDTQLMREANVRDAVARATYQGMIKYFRAIDGNTTLATELPPPVTGVRAVTNAAGSVTISWVPPVANAEAGGSPSGYRVYASTNGYGFDGGTAVAGGGMTSVTLTGYDPNVAYYFKVVAVNAGGESAGSEVVAVLPSGGTKQVLIVNGFDRLDRSQNPREVRPQADANGLVDRVRPRESNSRDYTAQVMAAIQTAAPGTHVNSTSNEAVASGAVNLTDYAVVVWISGEESTVNDTFDATEQTKVTQFLAAGGNLFVTGAEIGWDLDQQNNGRTFYENTLKANYVADSAGTYSVNGIAGGIFAGLSFSFDNGALFYNTEFADVINPQAGAQAALTYANGAGNAGIVSRGTGTNGSIVMFCFPFETITTAANRAAVMDRVLDFFENADFNGSGFVDAADYLLWRKSNGTTVARGTQGDANSDGFVDDADYQIWREQFGVTIAPTGSGSGSEAGGGLLQTAADATATSASDQAPVQEAKATSQDVAFDVIGSGVEKLSHKMVRQFAADVERRAAESESLLLATAHKASETAAAGTGWRSSKKAGLADENAQIDCSILRALVTIEGGTWRTL